MRLASVAWFALALSLAGCGKPATPNRSGPGQFAPAVAARTIATGMRMDSAGKRTMSAEERTIPTPGTPFKSGRPLPEVRRTDPTPEPRLTVNGLIEKYQSPEKWREIEGSPVNARLRVLRRVSMDDRMILWVTDSPELFVELATKATADEAVLKAYQSIAPGEVIEVVAIARAFDDGPGFDDARILPTPRRNWRDD